jgi:hypothetical protein
MQIKIPGNFKRQLVRTLTGEFQPRITNYKNKDGNMLLEKQILNRWKEHFKEILTDSNQENLQNVICMM